MISIYREEVRDLFKKNLGTKAEDLWMQLLDENPADIDLFIGLSIEFEKKGHEKDATALLAMSMPHLIENKMLKEAVDIMKRIAQLLPHDKETAEKTADYYKDLYKKFPHLKKIISVSKITDPTKNLIESMETFEDLTAFTVNSFCKHNSWGIGKIIDLNFETQTLTIDFYTKKRHKMAISLAVNALSKIHDDHISALKYKDIEKTKQIAKEDPVELVKIILRSYDNNKASLLDITDALEHDVIGQRNWKKWWDKTKNLLKSDPYIVVPERKGKIYTLLDEPVILEDKALKSYQNLSNFKEKFNFVAVKIKKQRKEHFNQDFYEEIAKDLAKIIEVNYSLNTSIALESYFTLDSLTTHIANATSYTDYSVKQILENTNNLGDIVRNITKLDLKKQALKEIKKFSPDRCTDIYTDLLSHCSLELMNTIIDDLMTNKENLTKIETILKLGYNTVGESSSILLWVSKNIKSKKYNSLIAPYINIKLLEKLIDFLDLCESGVIDDTNRSNSRIKDLLFNDNCAFVVSLLKSSDKNSILNVAKAIPYSSSLSKSDKQSLVAKFIINCPDVKDILHTDQPEKIQDTAIYSSQKAYDKKQEEFYHLVNILIPENAKKIGVARSHGDLRENFEYKAAKEEQSMLVSKKMETADMLAKIRIIDFTNLKTNQVSLGTSVKYKNIDDNTEKTVSIMGIWDTDVENGIISYLSPLAKGLIGKKTDEEITVDVKGTVNHYKIMSIEVINQ